MSARTEITRKTTSSIHGRIQPKLPDVLQKDFSPAVETPPERVKPGKSVFSPKYTTSKTPVTPPPSTEPTSQPTTPRSMASAESKSPHSAVTPAHVPKRALRNEWYQPGGEKYAEESVVGAIDEDGADADGADSGSKIRLNRQFGGIVPATSIKYGPERVDKFSIGAIVDGPGYCAQKDTPVQRVELVEDGGMYASTQGTIRGKKFGVRASLKVLTAAQSITSETLQRLYHDEHTTKRKIVVYTTSLNAIRATTTACQKVLTIFATLRKRVHVKDIYINPEYGIELGERLAAQTDAQTDTPNTPGDSVPRVFIAYKYVGGADDVVLLNDTGELKALCEDIEDGGSPACTTCGGTGYHLCTWYDTRTHTSCRCAFLPVSLCRRLCVVRHQPLASPCTGDGASATVVGKAHVT
eukprot:m.755324 g.755324  ORF g.755324 m.755324 type:complete len:411 (+) comp23179_c1_seq25:1844-3076(+)